MKNPCPSCFRTVCGIALAGLACLLGGCVVVLPVPSGTSKIEWGREVPRQQTAWIVLGRTTQAEIVAKFGGDFSDSPRVSALAYSWQYSGTKLAWWYGLCWSGGQGLEDLTGWKALFVAFDRNDRFVDFEFCGLYHLGEHKSLDEQLENWAQHHGAASTIGDHRTVKNENEIK